MKISRSTGMRIATEISEIIDQHINIMDNGGYKYDCPYGKDMIVKSFITVFWFVAALYTTYVLVMRIISLL